MSVKDRRSSRSEMKTTRMVFERAVKEDLVNWVIVVTEMEMKKKRRERREKRSRGMVTASFALWCGQNRRGGRNGDGVLVPVPTPSVRRRVRMIPSGWMILIHLAALYFQAHRALNKKLFLSLSHLIRRSGRMW